MGAVRRGEHQSVQQRDEVDKVTRELAEAVSNNAGEDEVAALVLTVGRFGDARSMEPLASLTLHSSSAVRRAVAEALPMTMTVPQTSGVGIDALLQLFDDENADVRDWAVCSLGRTLAQGHSVVPAPYDTAKIRSALIARLGDDDLATRAEACAGLALRHEPEVVEPLRRLLSGSTVGRVPVIAAVASGSPELYDSLVALRSWWDRDPELLERAIEACSLPD